MINLKRSGYNPIGVTIHLSAGARELRLPSGRAVDLSKLSKAQYGNIRSEVMTMAIRANPHFLGHRPHHS